MSIVFHIKYWLWIYSLWAQQYVVHTKKSILHSAGASVFGSLCQIGPTPPFLTCWKEKKVAPIETADAHYWGYILFIIIFFVMCVFISLASVSDLVGGQDQVSLVPGVSCVPGYIDSANHYTTVRLVIFSVPSWNKQNIFFWKNVLLSNFSTAKTLFNTEKSTQRQRLCFFLLFLFVFMSDAHSLCHTRSWFQDVYI